MFISVTRMEEERSYCPWAPTTRGRHTQYQQPGKAYLIHQIRGKAAVGIDGRNCVKVHEVQHQPVEEDQSALEQKLMPPAYTGELLQGIGAPGSPRSFSVTDSSFIYPFCLHLFCQTGL